MYDLWYDLYKKGQSQVRAPFTVGGNDSFSYTIMDSHGVTASASVSVQVKAVEPPPDGGSGDANLVLNGGAKLGLNGWVGVWGATIILSNDTHIGTNSIEAYSGRRAGEVFLRICVPRSRATKI